MGRDGHASAGEKTKPAPNIRIAGGADPSGFFPGWHWSYRGAAE